MVLAVVLSAGLTCGAVSVELHYFWAEGCPECVAMSRFLEELLAEHPELDIIRHEIGRDPYARQLMADLAHAYGLETEHVPAVFVGEQAVSGAGRAVEALIRQEVARCISEGCPSPTERLADVQRWRLGPVGSILLVTSMVALIVLWFAMTSP